MFNFQGFFFLCTNAHGWENMGPGVAGVAQTLALSLVVKWLGTCPLALSLTFPTCKAARMKQMPPARFLPSEDQTLQRIQHSAQRVEIVWERGAIAVGGCHCAIVTCNLLLVAHDIPGLISLSVKDRKSFVLLWSFCRKLTAPWVRPLPGGFSPWTRQASPEQWGSLSYLWVTEQDPTYWGTLCKAIFPTPLESLSEQKLCPWSLPQIFVLVTDEAVLLLGWGPSAPARTSFRHED
jgi:hypothetical protein